MKVLTDLASLRKVPHPLVLAAGFFDGVHRGHVKVIDRAVARARALRGKAWVLTFDAHPLKILNPAAAPPLLTSHGHKLKLLEQLHADGCLVMPFIRKLAGMEPEEFVSQLHECVPPLAEIFVGKNWRFGRQGRGGAGMLSRLSRGMDLRVNVVRPVVRKGETVSSTRIRAEILRGSLREAAVMLGRPFSVLGTVTRGRTVARRLGTPTANLDVHNEVLPPRGVYAARAVVAGKPLSAIANLGVRPTFADQRGKKAVLELHVLDFRRSLYGKDVEVFFARKLRDERRFPSPEALKRQIAADIEAAAAALNARSGPVEKR